MRSNAFVWDMYLCGVTEFDADGFLLASLDSYGQDASQPQEVVSPGGTWFRPRAPTADAHGNILSGCPMLGAWEGGKGLLIPLQDTRAVPKLPQPKEGGAGTFGDTGQGQLPFASFDGETGSWTLYVPYAFSGTTPGKAMLIAVDVASGNESISIVHGDGMSITMAAGGKNSVLLKNKAGDAYIEINDGGIVLNGNVTVNGGMVVGNVLLAKPVLTGAAPGIPSTFLSA